MGNENCAVGVGAGGCYELRGVHICAPSADVVSIRRGWCPTCSRRTFFVGFHYEWYGWNQTCLKCGENFADGEQMERPFVRGWREDSKRRARAAYRRYRAHHPAKPK